MENLLSNFNASVRQLLLSRGGGGEDAQQKSAMAHHPPQSRLAPQSPTTPSRGRRSALLSMVVILIVCLSIAPAGASAATPPTAITDADLQPTRSLLQAGNAVGTINAVLAITSQVVGGVAKVVNAGVGIVSPAANAVSSHIPLLVPAIGGRCPPNSTPTLLPNINRVVFCDLGTAQQAVNVALQTAQGFANAAASLVPSGLPALPYFPAARARGRRMLLRFGEAA